MFLIAHDPHRPVTTLGMGISGVDTFVHMTLFNGPLAGRASHMAAPENAATISGQSAHHWVNSSPYPRELHLPNGLGFSETNYISHFFSSYFPP